MKKIIKIDIFSLIHIINTSDEGKNLRGCCSAPICCYKKHTLELDDAVAGWTLLGGGAAGRGGATFSFSFSTSTSDFEDIVLSIGGGCDAARSFLADPLSFFADPLGWSGEPTSPAARPPSLLSLCGGFDDVLVGLLGEENSAGAVWRMSLSISLSPANSAKSGALAA